MRFLIKRMKFLVKIFHTDHLNEKVAFTIFRKGKINNAITTMQYHLATEALPSKSKFLWEGSQDYLLQLILLW